MRSERRRLLTIYGRKAVHEALQDPALDCRTLHLATSNRPTAAMRDLRRTAEKRGTGIRERRLESGPIHGLGTVLPSCAW